MKKGSLYSLIAGGMLFISSCAVQVQTYDMSEDYAVSLHNPDAQENDKSKKQPVQEETSLLVGVPARSFYGGDLKRGGIWWASKGIYIEKGDTMVIEVEHVGADSILTGATNPAINPPTHPFGATFPPIDLIKEPVMIKVTAKAVAKDTSLPVLHLQLGDAEGYQTNTKRPSNKIQGSEVREYYFDTRDIFMQSEPEQHRVNGAMITNLQFFINPGELPGYTGQILITEIKIVPIPAAPAK